MPRPARRTTRARRLRPGSAPPSRDTETLTAAACLQLMWLASPALPVGGFSYSEALEAAVDTGRVTDADSAGAWLRDQLQLGQTRNELAVTARAFSAWKRHDLPRIHELNDWVLHTRERHELRQQTEQMGRSLLEWMKPRRLDDPRVAALAALRPAPTWPASPTRSSRRPSWTR